MKNTRQTIILGVIIITALIAGMGILNAQKQNRLNTYTEVFCNGHRLVLNAEEFRDYQENKDFYLTETLKLEEPEFEEQPEVVEVQEEEEVTGPQLVSLGVFRLTGYCDCPICQEEWVGTTALGVAPTEHNTIAVDPDVIPLGSYVWINGTRYHAEDVGGMINENHIDVFCGSHEECYSDFCNGYAEVYLEVQHD